MVIAAAAEAFIDLVEPNWVISSTTSLASMASSLSPGSSCPNRDTRCSGISYISILGEEQLSASRLWNLLVVSGFRDALIAVSIAADTKAYCLPTI